MISDINSIIFLSLSVVKIPGILKETGSEKVLGKMMKKTLVIILLTLVGIGLFVLGFFAKPLSQHFYQTKVLVKVNNMPITDRDLKLEIDFLRVSESTPLSNITKEDVLDRMINDALILNEARKFNLTINDDNLVTYKQAVWEGYSESDKEKSLKANGLTLEVWNEIIKKRLLVEQTISRVVEDQVHVGENEVEEYYWTHLLEFYKPVRVLARQIVVETEEQAQTIKKQLDDGADFQQLAKKFSRGPEKDQGGDLGWVTAEDLPKAFTEVLFNMKEKQISNPIATAYGYHIFYVETRALGGKTALNEAKSEIIEKLKFEKTDKVFQAWLEEIRAQAVVTFINN